MNTTRPLIIVGSRLQALIFAVSAAAIAIGLWDRFGPALLIVVLPLLVAAGFTVHRRVELHADHAVIRNRLRSAQSVQRHELRASTGHRYLRIESEMASIRIEVPVEIRPEVREWAAETGLPD